ncbi:hypothetical protein ACTFIW_013342 [Dictyostelium discoideum]
MENYLYYQQQPFLSLYQRTHDDSDTENEQSDDESSNNVDVPTDYQLSDTVSFKQRSHMGTCRVRFEFANINTRALEKALRYVERWQTGNTCELVSYNDVSSKIDKTPFLCSLALITGLRLKEQEVNLPVGGCLFHHKQVWNELDLPNFCQEVANGLKARLLPNLKADTKPNSVFNSRGSKIRLYHKGSTRLVIRRCCRTSTSKPSFKAHLYSNVFTFPKPGTTLHRPVLDLKRLNTYINNQSFNPTSKRQWTY